MRWDDATDAGWPHPATRSVIKVLFVASELAPLAKTGGLADVAASLPNALRGLGVDCRVLVPGYPAIRSASSNWRHIATVAPLAALPAARIVEGNLGDVPVFAVECESLYERGDDPYYDGHGRKRPDNALRFAPLSRAAAALGSRIWPTTWQPDVVHCNDWQSGLTPAYLHFGDGPRAATVFTVHNGAYQGNFHRDLVAALGLPPSCFDIHGVEFHGQLSFLKAGIYYSDHITTVSPTHAAEIQTEALGHGLYGLLHARRHRLVGILSQRYGTPPIVHAAGGLVDTVTHCIPEKLSAGTATGFQFQPFNRKGLLDAITTANSTYRNHQFYRSLQKNGMRRDFGWQSGARAYGKLRGTPYANGCAAEK
jgi:glycogen synthase